MMMQVLTFLSSSCSMHSHIDLCGLQDVGLYYWSVALMIFFKKRAFGALGNSAKSHVPTPSLHVSTPSDLSEIQLLSVLGMCRDYLCMCR